MAVSSEIWADEIITPRSQGGTRKFSPGRILVSNGKITEVSSLSAAKLKSASKKIHRAKVATPGLVDPHTHLVFAGNRADEWNARLKGATYQEIAAKGGGILKTVQATRDASLKDLVQSGINRCSRILKNGVTTVEIKSGYGLDLKSELKILKAIQEVSKKTPVQILATFMGAHALPPEFKSHKDYLRYLNAKVLPVVSKLAKFQDVFCEKGYFSESESIEILKAGKKWGLIPKVHAHEFGRTGGVSAAAKAGAVSADHLMVMNAADIQKLKKSKVIPVILPGTSFFLGGKAFAPARAFLDAGLKVAIGSDFNPGTNPTLNFPLCGTFAAVFQKLTLEEVLTGQSWNAALALGLRDRGCLERGMRADIALWDCDKFEEIYYSYGSSRVTSVYLGGKKVF